MLKKDGIIIYVGKTIRGISRINQHERNREFDSFIFWPAPPESLKLWEKAFIKAYNPTQNQIHSKMKRINYEDALGRPRWKFIKSHPITD